MTVKIEFRAKDTMDILTGIITKGALLTNVTSITFVNYVNRTTNTIIATGLPVITASADATLAGTYYFTYTGADPIDYKITGISAAVTYTLTGEVDPVDYTILETLEDYTINVPITALYPTEYLVVDGQDNPIPNVMVWLTSDIGGTVLVGKPDLTDSRGIVIFNVIQGSYYVWRKLTGYVFNPNPDVWTVA